VQDRVELVLGVILSRRLVVYPLRCIRGGAVSADVGGGPQVAAAVLRAALGRPAGLKYREIAERGGKDAIA